MSKKEFLEKYGKVLVLFSRYNKCVFTFSTKKDNLTIFIEVGGCLENIYGLEISTDLEEPIENLDPFSGRVYKDNVLIESFYE